MTKKSYKCQESADISSVKGGGGEEAGEKKNRIAWISILVIVLVKSSLTLEELFCSKKKIDEMYVQINHFRIDYFPLLIWIQSNANTEKTFRPTYAKDAQLKTHSNLEAAIMIVKKINIR